MANGILKRKIPRYTSDDSDPRVDQYMLVEAEAGGDEATRNRSVIQGGLNPAGPYQVEHFHETDAPGTTIDTRTPPVVSKRP